MSILPPNPAETPAAPQPAAAPVTYRDFGDAEATRSAIYTNVLDAARGIQPVKNANFQLGIENVDYEDPEHISIPKQKQLLLTGGSAYRRLRGDWVLRNLAGDEIERKRSTLAQVPHMTQRGAFILNGTHNFEKNQMRLDPGVYTRVQENGLIESHANVKPGKGMSHRYSLEPATGVFKMNFAQASMPLLPVLKAFGVTDSELRKVWGNELYAANAGKDDPRVIDKLYQRLVRKGGAEDIQDKTKAVVEALQRMEFDPEVNRRTLGAPHAKLDKDTLFAITSKLLAVNRGEADVDDRDHLAYQHFLGPEDLLAERLRRPGLILHQLLWRASTKGSLKTLPVNAFDKHLRGAIQFSGLGQNTEDVNPAEWLDLMHAATRLGTGGISSIDSVPDEARSVQPSHVGYIDLTKTPECYDRETEVMTRYGWKLWPDVVADDELACLIDGRLEYHKPDRLVEYDYDGEMCGLSTNLIDYLVTPDHRMWVAQSYKRPCDMTWFFATAAEVHGRSRRFMCGGFLPLLGERVAEFVLPDIVSRRHELGYGGNAKKFDAFKFEDFAELLGWYLAEGSFTYDEPGTLYVTKVSQSETVNPGNCRRIERLFGKLELPGRQDFDKRGYTICGRQLAAYFSQFGFCDDKWIPEEFLSADRLSRFKLFAALLRGDGRHGKRGRLNQFCSSSKRLADGFQRLAFSLGYSTRMVFEKDDREERYLGCWVTHIHLEDCRNIQNRGYYRGEPRYYKTQYRGKVYCATVPGGLMHVRRHNSSGIWCGNSSSAGVESRMSYAARKGSDGRVYAPYHDPKTGEEIYKSPQQVTGLTLAFPNELESGEAYVAAMKDGKTRYVPREQVDLVMPHAERWFSPLSNLVPFKQNSKGQRTSMGARFYAQALPLVGAEAPLVRMQVPGETGSFAERYGRHLGAVHANKAAGQVESVSPDEIKVRYADGTVQTHELYNEFPNNRKTFLHNTPLVQAGDPVEPGQLLAKSNYTDDKGHVALGLNLRTAYHSYDGRNFEDAYVISESAAKRLSSEHLYQHSLDFDPGQRRGKKDFVSIFASKFPKKLLETLDDAGVVKPGTVVKYGDPLVLAATERDATHKSVHSPHKGSFIDRSLLWEHHEDGIVTDAPATAKGVTVAVKTVQPMREGDKLSGSYGDKGIVSRIVPDEEMPRDPASGQVYEVLANPLGIITRTNPAQKLEAWLGKIAYKTGKPYVVPDFQNRDAVAWVEGELKKHGLTGMEDVFDPKIGRNVNVSTGMRYFMKLHHQAGAKGQGRGLGAYTSEGQPAKPGGQVGSAKRMSGMDIYAFLSSGATGPLRDARLIRGQNNQEYWAARMSGFQPPTPDMPGVYTKFNEMLRGAGVNVERKGSKLHLLALTDKAIDERAENREIQNSETVDWRDGLKPKEGGLFDTKLTGGHDGNKWSFIKLHEPLPNPVYEEPIRHLLRLTGKQFDAVLFGKEKLDGKTGPAAIGDALAKIRVPTAIAQAREEVKGGRKMARDAAVRRLRYLKGLETQGLEPKDWMLSKVPVLPPALRPVSQMATGQQLVSDMNYAYKELFDANQNLKELSGKLPDISEERAALYNSFRAVVGLGDPVQPKNQERGVRGLLAQVFSSSPKFGAVQRKLLGTTMDLVGRAVVAPNPDLSMDEVGIPEARAWEVYAPFLVGRMVRQGVGRAQALEHVESRHPLARKALVAEMDERPVLVSRAPVLHRWGRMAFFPRLVKGDVMQVSPLVVKGFNMDFDGDQSNYEVVADDEAAKEALHKMLPSRNLVAASDFKTPMHAPTNEYHGGLFAATGAVNKAKRARVFAKVSDALRAWERGEMDPSDPVEVGED